MRTEDSFTALMTSILECRSNIVIHMTIDSNLLDVDLTVDQRKVLEEMDSCHDLDKIYLMAAKELKLNTKVEELELWISQKANRNPHAETVAYILGED
jgi:hypothetical protein